MAVVHSTRTASIDEISAEMDRRGSVIEKLEARVASLETVLKTIADAPAWGAPERWETTPSEVRQLARAALDAVSATGEA